MKLVRIVAFTLATFVASPSFAADGPKWSEWSDDLFARAQAEQRFVILDLEAVWCHWCHVMEEQTYADPAVADSWPQLLPCRSIRTPVLTSRAVTGTGAGRRRSCWPRRPRDRQRSGLYPARTDAGSAQGDIADPSPGPSVGVAFEVTPSASAVLEKDQRVVLTQVCQRI